MTPERIAQLALPILIALLSAAIPAHVAYDLYSRGTNPPKRVDYTSYGAIDPFRELSHLGSAISMRFRINDVELMNIKIINTQVTNTGQSPIVPSDIYEGFTISVKSPWKIAAVANVKGDHPRVISVDWKRISDTSFRADPALLNPGDRIEIRVYVSGPDLVSAPPENKRDPEVLWNARISNLPTIGQAEGFLDRYQRQSWGIHVELQGWGVIFVILAMSVFELMYLMLLKDSGYLDASDWRPPLFILLSSLMSLAAAEASATWTPPETGLNFAY